MVWKVTIFYPPLHVVYPGKDVINILPLMNKLTATINEQILIY